MEEREIGTSGILASVIGLGCNSFGMFQDAAQATACVEKALDLGITLFDMASEHGEGREEELVGAALGSRRQDVVIATKVGGPQFLHFAPDGTPLMSGDESRQGLTRRWITKSVEESLKRLGTDYIDLYQTHVSDAETSREETLGALDDLVRQGKVRAIGEAVPRHERALDAMVADLAESLDLAAASGLTSFVSEQTEYNLLVRGAEDELIPELRKRGISLLPYGPLAYGLLTGKYRSGAPYPAGSRLDKLPSFRGQHGEQEWEKMEGLRAFAASRNMTMVELAIAWLLSEPVVASVIAGATTPEQVSQNVGAASKTLSEEDRGELDRITGGAAAIPDR